jgi:glycosyltransferase involved in cell wall biosynthesis
MRIVFWQNILSPHLSAAIRSLSAMGNDTVIVAAERMSGDRKAQGWNDCDFGQSRIVVSPGRNEIRELVHGGDAESIHLLGGVRWTALGKTVTGECLKSRARVGIISEAADAAGWKGLLRRARYANERIGTGRRFDLVLAMGEMGVRWFRDCGYDARRVFPYAYVTESASTRAADRTGSDAYRVVFVGQLIPRKGLDTLCGSLSRLRELNWRLTVVGDGGERAQLHALAHRLGIDERVEWQGTLSNGDALGQIEQSDLLVLPSRFDGWGAVVNEALLRGVPVICSDRCGAADLLAESWRGGVFRTGDVADLSRLLAERIRGGRRTADSADRIRNWSRAIKGPAVAQYLVDILDHVYHGKSRPSPPWNLEEAALP